MITFDNELDKELYKKYLVNIENKIDKKDGLIKMWRGENGYHSCLKNCYCSYICENLCYAGTLLKNNPETNMEKALDLISRVISMQDIDESSDTFGVWPYYFEEPIEKMNPPDWNMADFNGKGLIKLLIGSGDLLPNELKSKIKQAIKNACFAIVKRDVGAIYTNVSVMDCYVTIVAGDMFGWDDYYEYGCKKLKALYDYNMKNGSFSEYNSPCYTFVTLYDLCDLIADVKDEKCQGYIKTLYDLAWETIAVHFHKPTNQLAGPHFRAYDMFMPKEHILAIQRAIGQKVKLLEDDEILTLFPNGASFNPNLICPDKFLHYFTDEPNDNIVDITFAPSLMAYTYQNEKYTLGSIHSEKLWNQHRNILAYWGTKDEPIALNIKCLHDGWDYCSCLTSTVQDKGNILTSLGFLTDQGDTHVTLDMVKDKKIEAEDFRVCWLFCGNVDAIEYEKSNENTYRFIDKENNLKFDIAFDGIMFDGFNPKIEVEKTNGEIKFSVILHHGKRKIIDFGKMTKAIIISALTISNIEDNNNNNLKISVCDDVLTAGFGDLKVITPFIPQTQEEKISDTKLYRNNKEYKPEF